MGSSVPNANGFLTTTPLAASTDAPKPATPCPPTTPAMPPMTASVEDSMRTMRMIVARRAPSARIVAISRWRSSVAPYIETNT